MTDMASVSRPDSPALLDVCDLSVDFAGEHRRLEVVSDVSFDVRPGETLGLVGESGSGKTVTGLSIMGLIPDPPGRITSGQISFEGRDLRTMSDRQLRNVRGSQISMIFQDPMTSLSPSFTVGDQIAEAVRLHLGSSRGDARKRAVEMLDLVGIPQAASRVDRYPHEFSGGMRQRVMIAIALSCQPKLLIADEPTSALDVSVQARVLELFAEIQAEHGFACLFVTHDLAVVDMLADRIAVLTKGEMVEEGNAADVLEHPQHPYTQRLLASLPVPDPVEQARRRQEFIALNEAEAAAAEAAKAPSA